MTQSPKTPETRQTPRTSRPFACFSSLFRLLPLRLAVHLSSIAGLIAGVLFAPAVNAQCHPDNKSAIQLRVENDLLSGSSQDQGYSSGLQFGWVSPDLAGNTDGAGCLPAATRALYRGLRWLQPAGQAQHMLVSLEQMLFTPHDKTRTDLITTDRPYAATLALNLGLQARQGNRLRTHTLSAGVIGPAALGKQTQNNVHQLLGNARFRGWNHQLKNEPLLQIATQTRTRRAGSGARSAWSWDAITYWGGALGNLATHLNAGGELRTGLRLPDNFGSGRLAGAEGSRRNAASSGWAGHAFVALDIRAVARDLTLDGSTWRNSHKVNKRHVVGELGYGFALTWASWHMTAGRYHRTREFSGQSKRPVFGSVRVGYAF